MPDVPMTCEEHPDKEWPHDECGGPGMPWTNSLRLLVPRAALEQVGWRWPNGSLSIDTRYRPATNCLPVYRLTEEAE